MYIVINQIQNIVIINVEKAMFIISMKLEEIFFSNLIHVLLQRIIHLGNIHIQIRLVLMIVLNINTMYSKEKIFVQ